MKPDVYCAFGNKIRTKLLLCLSEKSKNVTEMIAICGLTQSAVSQHLKKLKAAGLVSTRKIGKEVVYTLTYPAAADISKHIISLEKEVT
jgi:ArsR family transcriptional regulator